MNEFIEVPKAKELLKGLAISPKNTQVTLSQALGRFTASPVLAPMNVPSFDNSGMDGYAFSWEDLGESRKLAQVVQAGANPDFNLEKGAAVRIFTGAPIPKGADTVVQQEWVDVVGDTVFFELAKLTQGMNVRKAGSQCQEGELILNSGTLITPGTIGLLASLGIEQVGVFDAPKVSVILTGDEILEIGQTLQPGQIYNANGPALMAYLSQLGIDKVEVLKVRDEKSEVSRVIGEALESSGIVLLTGGISVGDYDFVKGSLEENGVQQLFYKVKQKPGKPIFAGIKGEKLVFALPGNPASVLTCFIQYVKPCLLRLLGNPNAWTSPVYYPIAADFNKKAPLTFFLKAKLENNRAVVLPAQESFNLLSFGEADGILEIPEMQEHLEEGSLVAFYPW
ncbi:gephyrin-like molybdotransferase Glp [Algoriphagus sp. AK58]|uniref:molybdopterin molybdotransferase MoeA n=1 Tax=Algoriphagus sp. AK58 TaxID=1406877 RepID=UPI00164FDBC6|nr:gephyrin-like molybdotransferase Glp [Algoriphagus sp. AK58]MBC6365902.1 molybdopterin molybdenumtransferase MoeA [Algoriphagus sp. AK58]